MNIYPLSYSIPEEIFDDSVAKENNLADLVPGKSETYIYENQDDYYNMYGKARFGITHKKYGWDCLRHYEMLANNCIPFFENLDKCPKNTMITFPKNLIIKANKNMDFNKYHKEIFQYAKNNLTCKQSAKYVLDIISKLNKDKNNGTNVNKPSILMLSGVTGYRNVNYTRELLAIGLRKKLGVNFIEYPKINSIYKNCKKLHKYVGKGFTYGGILDDVYINRHNILERIINEEFDYIIYGKVGKKRGEIDEFENLQYWNKVSRVYDKNQIIFIYGGDLCRSKEDEDLKYHFKKGICFVRELT